MALEKENFELKLMVQKLNLGNEPHLSGKYLSDGTFALYPVGVEKWKEAMMENVMLKFKLKKLEAK